MVVITHFPVLSFKLQLPREQKHKMDGYVGKKKKKPPKNKNLQDQQHYPQAKFGPLLVFVKSFIGTLPHPFSISYGCFPINVPNCVVVLNYGLQKKSIQLQNTYSLTLHRKFVNPALEHMEEFLFLHIFLHPKTNRMIYEGIKEKNIKLSIYHSLSRKKEERD